jgi:hypothetical protein
MAKKTVYRFVITSKSKEVYLASTKREAEAWTKKNGGTFRKAKASDRDKFPGYNIVVPRTASRASRASSARARRSVKAAAMEAKTWGGSQPRYSRRPNLQFERFKAERKGSDTAVKLTGGFRAQSQGKKPKWPSEAKIFEAAQLPVLNAARRGGRTKLLEDQQYYFAAMESAAFLANMWARAGTKRQKEMVKDAGAQAINALKREYPWDYDDKTSGIKAAAKGDEDWRRKFRTY